MSLRIAAAQFGVFQPVDWADYERRLEALIGDAVRQQGQVLNHRHWPEQVRPPLRSARVLAL
jgi:hypothetical protein